MPILDQFLLKNPIRKWMSAHGFIKGTPVAHFAMRRIAETNVRATSTFQKDDFAPKDFLSRFQEAHAKDPDFMSQERVLALTVANMFAGSDTTAISLRAIFYNLIRNPGSLMRLRAEIDNVGAKRCGSQSKELLAWNEVRQLPYLSAVISESLRTHPAAGLALERIVPPGGLQMGHVVLPGGTNVGCNAWALHLDQRIWGKKPERWIPERWIDATDAQKAEMRNSLFTFGAGARTCIGKNISYLEMYKLVPAVLGEFDVSPLHQRESIRNLLMFN